MKFTGGVKTLLPLRTGSLPNGFRGSRIRQIVYAMNLAALIVLTACLQVSARGYSQERVSLVEKDAPLKEVLKEIGRQTGYRYFFVDQWEAQAKKITIDVKNVSLETALDLCFKDQPFTYGIVDQTIVVHQKAVKSPTPGRVLEPGVINIHGHVTDENGQPVAGVTVSVKGSKQATFTNKDGEFILSNTDKGAVLIFSGANVETFSVHVAGQAELMVKLTAKVNKLDEVQVIAYGTTTQRLSTGNISTVKAVDIEEQPVSNPLLALEGRVPGLFITQYSGLPGSGVTVRVQGQNSILNGNDPLYIIDGIPYSSQLISGSSLANNPSIGNLLGGGGSPLSYINPSDIESIAVLKDADATAIYGSRAANGAILITTKKGKEGQTKIDINGQQGWGLITRKLNLLNTQQYLEMRHEALLNDGISSPSATDYDINGLWDTTRYTNWQKAFISGTAQYTNITGSISGGNANTQYFVSGTYHRETLVFPGNFADKKGSVHFNLNNVSANQKFRMQLSGSYMVDNNQLPTADLTGYIYLSPDAPILHNTDGSLNWAPNSAGASTWTNPLSYLYQPYQNKTNNLISNAILSYRIFPGVEIKTSLGYTNMQVNEFDAIGPLIAKKPETRLTSSRTAWYTNNNVNSFIIEPQVRYKRNIGSGKLDFLVGTTILRNNNNGQFFTGTGYNSDAVLGDIHSAATVTVNSNVISVYRYNALFGRINYNWMDKYIMDLTLRRDGSSRFGDQNQFHNFGSVGASWIFSEEGFMRGTIPFLSFGKFRGSFGTTGNDQIGDYRFLNLYNPTSVGAPYQNTTGLAITGLPNPYLQWEETKKLQGGIELGFLKDRILLTTNYVYNRSSNELLQYALPSLTGFSSVTTNFPATVQNTSWEFALTTANIRSNSFTWSSNLNLTIPQNKLVAFPGLASSTYATRLIIGQPINIVKVYHFLGVNPTTGVYQFPDNHGNPTPSPTQQTAFINTLPKFYGGFGNTVSYKGFQIDIFVQFVKQIGQKYIGQGIPGQKSSGALNNEPINVLNRWQKTGDITSTQRFSTNASLITPFYDAQASDYGYGDASFIRLKNISVSYQLPATWIRRARMQSCRLYLQGQNLFTITGFQGMDPENQNPNVLPPLRILTVGLQVGL